MPRITTRTYSEMLEFDTFINRYRYLRLADHQVGEDTFGNRRYLNQLFYHSKEWRSIRKDVILRDNGCDLAIPDREIDPIKKRKDERRDRKREIVVHHIDPITVVDLFERSEYLLLPEFLVCCSNRTHKAIHYGDETLLLDDVMVERRPNDTCPWR